MSSRKGKDPRTKEPLFYDEKKKQVSMQLTPTAIASLDQAASARGISRSELVEQYARSGCGEQHEALKEAVLFYLVSTKGCAPDRLNSKLILNSLNRLQEAFERSQSKG